MSVVESRKQRVVVIGGVALGAGVAAKARRISEQAEITVIEKGPYVSFANCGLPYYLGGVIEDRNDLLLHTPESLRARFNLDVRVLHEAEAIDREHKTVQVHALETGEVVQLPYDKLVIATGAKPIAPRIPGGTLAGIFSVRGLPDVDAIKAWIEHHHAHKAVVIGGGFIGLEVVENLARLGLDVTVVEKAEQVMPPFDPEITAPILDALDELGVHTVLGNGVAGFSGTERAQSVTLEDGTEIAGDLFVMSLGVRPDVEIARQSNLAVGINGAVSVNDRLQTSDPDIFAGGDVAELRYDLDGSARWIALAGAPNKQARVIAENLFGADQRFFGAHGTSIVRVGTTVAALTGWSEKAAAAAGMDYVVSYTTSGHHATYYPGAEDLTIKLVLERESGKLLGAQAVGKEGVDKRIDVLSVALTNRMTATDLTHLDLAYAPPFGSAKDPVIMSGMAAENLVLGKVEAVWNVDEADGRRVRLIDVRDDDEVAEGMLPGALHIPLDQLRSRASELDRSVRWIVYCRSGHRSYFASCMLTGLGFSDVCHLSGGYIVQQMKARARVTPSRIPVQV